MKRVITSEIENETLEREALDYFQLAIKVYCDMYLKRFGRLPMPSYHIKQLEKHGQKKKDLKYAKIFRDVVGFLSSEKLKAGASNSMFRLLQDYYKVIFSYYARYNRAPTINQIAAGMINTSQFITFVNNEEATFGSYWMNREEIEKAQELVRTGGNEFRDELLESYKTLPPSK
jgi:hypothetical protein